MFNSQHRYRRQVYKTGSVVGIGPFVARTLTVTLLIVFSALYLVQHTQGASYITELRKLEAKSRDLNQELLTLEVNVNRIKSLQQIQESAKELGLVAAPANPSLIDISQDR